MWLGTRRSAVAAIVLALLLGGCRDDGGDASDGTTTTAEGSDASGPSFTVAVTPEAVVPGPGSTDASGEFTVTLDTEARVLCVEGSIDGLADAGPTHLLLAPAGQPGPIMAELPPPSTSTSGGDSKITTTTIELPEGANCVATRPDEVFDQLVERPYDFAIVVRSREFPEGALRGQLAEAPPEESTTTAPMPPTPPTTDEG